MASPHLNLASLHLRTGDVDAALEGLQRASKLDPSNPVIHYVRGVAHYASGELEPATRALRRSIKLGEDFEAPRLLLRRVEAGEPATFYGDPTRH